MLSLNSRANDMNNSEEQLESIVKVEAERFEDEHTVNTLERMKTRPKWVSGRFNG